MRKLLLDVFEPCLKDYEYKTIGNSIVIVLDENRRIECSFYNTHSIDVYDAIIFTLTSKINGQINKKIVKFSSLFDCMQDLTHPNKIGKHIWVSNMKYRWYGKPTSADIQNMRNELINYIEIWK